MKILGTLETNDVGCIVGSLDPQYRTIMFGDEEGRDYVDYFYVKFPCLHFVEYYSKKNNYGCVIHRDTYVYWSNEPVNHSNNSFWELPLSNHNREKTPVCWGLDTYTSEIFEENPERLLNHMIQYYFESAFTSTDIDWATNYGDIYTFDDWQDFSKSYKDLKFRQFAPSGANFSHHGFIDFDREFRFRNFIAKEPIHRTGFFEAFNG